MQYLTLTLMATIITMSGLVSGHGYPKSVTVNGKTYPGANGPGADHSHSPIRPVTTGDPIDGVNDPIMLCGRGAKPAPVSAAIRAGDTIQVAWQGEEGGHWIHNVGPIQTYMTKCPGPCSQFTPSSTTQWFKIQALGFSSKSSSSDEPTWYMSKIYNGAPVSLLIPSKLQDGEYLIRQEFLALQNAQFTDKAEFYPACIQVAITGGSGGGEGPSPTTTFPGAYKDTDRGIHVDVYTPPYNREYVMPGPAIANIVQGSSPSQPSPPSSSPSVAPLANVAPAPSSATASPQPTETSSSRKCRTMQKRDLVALQRRKYRHRRRHV